MTNSQRQAALRERRKAEGLVQVNVWLPAEAAAELAIAAELIRQNPNLRVARLVDVTTGKLAGLKGVK